MYVKTDLHGHTYCSDGRASPEAYVEFRRELGFQAIAIADHDVMSALPRGARAAKAAGMLFIPAVEVTAFLHFGTDSAEQFHVLAYYPEAFLRTPRFMQSFLYQRGIQVQTHWRAFVLNWIDLLDKDDRIALSSAELEALPPHEFPALQTMIGRILERRSDLFHRFREHHIQFWESNRELFGWAPEEAIDCIRADGAVDIVAHPARYRDKERTHSILLRSSGLEVYTSRHKAEIAASFRSFAEKNRKHWTSSSDDHQNARYVAPACGTPLPTLEKILKTRLPLSLILPKEGSSPPP